MPIDLVIDERDSSKPDLGDSNNNSGARASTGDGHHTDGSSTPDVVSLLFLLWVAPIAKLVYHWICNFWCIVISINWHRVKWIGSKVTLLVENE